MPIVHLRVEGQVQGVGFRWFVRERSRALDLAGWVRNTADGAVELAALGDEASIEALVVEVRQGPPGAFVRALIRLDPPGAAEYPSPFRIER